MFELTEEAKDYLRAQGIEVRAVNAPTAGQAASDDQDR